MFTKILILSLAGAAGTLSRYYMSSGVQKLFNSEFPWGTTSVNLVGSLAFAVIWAMGKNKLAISEEAKFYILTGFLGAYTTFSTFMFDTVKLMNNSNYLYAFLNIFGQTLIGVACVFLGLYLGSKL